MKNLLKTAEGFASLKTLAFFICIGTLSLFMGCGKDDSGGIMPDPDPEIVTILEGIEDNEDISTLSTAFSMYEDLKESLQDTEESYTIFAPSDEAFDNFLAEHGKEGLDDISADLLQEILLHHVVKGKAWLSSDLSNDQVISTERTGESVSLTIAGEDIFVDKAYITNADLEFDNGVVHIIDQVLIVQSDLFSLSNSNVLELISDDTELSQFATLLDGFDDLKTALSDENGAYTIFVPSNDAINELLDELDITSIDQLPDDNWKEFLQHHIMNGNSLFLEDINPDETYETLAGETLTIVEENGSIAINGANVTTADQIGSNGIVHLMDRVLYEPEIDFNPADYDWGVIGNATAAGWEHYSDRKLQYLGIESENGVNTYTWAGVVTFTDTEGTTFKFRANNAWDINLGIGTDQEVLYDGSENTLVLGGGIFNSPGAGAYYITLKTSNNGLTWIVTMEPGGWGIIGDGSSSAGGWDEDVDMMTTGFEEGITYYTYTGDFTDAGSWKFRAGDSYDLNLGGPDIDPLSFRGENIAIATGTYTITLSFDGEEYEAELAPAVDE